MSVVQDLSKQERLKCRVFQNAPTASRFVADEIAAALTSAGFSGASVSVAAVTDLPRHTETNKLKRFVIFSAKST